MDLSRREGERERGEGASTSRGGREDEGVGWRRERGRERRKISDIDDGSLGVWGLKVTNKLEFLRTMFSRILAIF